MRKEVAAARRAAGRVHSAIARRRENGGFAAPARKKLELPHGGVGTRPQRGSVAGTKDSRAGPGRIRGCGDAEQNGEKRAAG